MKPQLLQKLFCRLWKHIDPRRRLQFGMLLSLMIGVSFAEVVSIGMTLPFLSVLTAPERVFEHQLAAPTIHFLGFREPNQLLLPISIAFGAAAIIAGLMRICLVWAQTRLGHAIGADLGYKIYQRTLYQPYIYHLQRNSSEVITGIINKTDTVVYQSLLPALTIISSSLLLFSILAVLILIKPMAAIAAFSGFSAIYIAIMLLTKSRLAKYSKIIAQQASLVLKTLQEGFGGLRDVLIDGTQATFCDLYRNANQPLRRAAANVQIIGAIPRYGIEAMGMVFVAGLAFSLSRYSDGVTNAVPLIGILAIGAQRLLPALQQAYFSWSAIVGSKTSLVDTLNLLDQALPEYANDQPAMPLTFRDNITLRSLGFRYTTESPWVLKNIDLTIPKGGRIGFIGSTGSGKSTLLDIIMALLSPTEGSITIDGCELTRKNHRAWQTNIAHVPQVIYLADKTIEENIAFGIPEPLIDHNRVRHAAMVAQISQTIEGWESQYETIVGENGVRLSGGQRQRIGIARAIYKKASVIVFDEATSALDTETENAVMQAIDSLGDNRTIMIIAHRLTTLKNCDLIVELQPGKGIKRIINYQELSSEGLTYEK